MSTVRRVVIDHIALPVADLERSARFYEAALAPLGFEVIERTDTQTATTWRRCTTPRRGKLGAWAGQERTDAY